MDDGVTNDLNRSAGHADLGMNFGGSRASIPRYASAHSLDTTDKPAAAKNPVSNGKADEPRAPPKTAPKPTTKPPLPPQAAPRSRSHSQSTGLQDTSMGSQGSAAPSRSDNPGMADIGMRGLSGSGIVFNPRALAGSVEKNLDRIGGSRPNRSMDRSTDRSMDSSDSRGDRSFDRNPNPKSRKNKGPTAELLGEEKGANKDHTFDDSVDQGWKV